MTPVMQMRSSRCLLALMVRHIIPVADLYGGVLLWLLACFGLGIKGAVSISLEIRRRMRWKERGLQGNRWSGNT
jgi:hypothetical protein